MATEVSGVGTWEEEIDVKASHFKNHMNVPYVSWSSLASSVCCS